MPHPVVFSLDHTVGEDKDKSGQAGLDSETFTLRRSLKLREGTSLAIQWLRLCLPTQGVKVQFLVRKLRSHIPHSQKTKT